MKCPECQIDINEVKISSHYVIPIVLDQCSKCGGIWFDESELYRTKHGAARDVEKFVNADKLSKFTLLQSKELHCPRDKIKLKPLRDSYSPQNVQIETCPECGGFWFNYGEFTNFQTKRIRTINKKRKTFDSSKTRKNLTMN